MRGEFLIQNTEDKILDFKNLEKGWCYGEGIPIKDNVITQAMELHKVILHKGFGQTDAFPGLNGEVRITAYTAFDYLEFTFESFDKITFTYETKEVMVPVSYQEGLTLHDAILCVVYSQAMIRNQTKKLSKSKNKTLDIL